MKIKAEKLTGNVFAPFGTFYDPFDTGAPLDGEWGRVNFFPDRLVLRIPCGNQASVSALIIKPGPFTLKQTEWHETDEALGGFTQDAVFHVGSPTWSETPDYAAFRAFLLPKGWWVRTKRGVWHHAPFVTGGETAAGTVILPPHTYDADCTCITINERIKIEL